MKRPTQKTKRQEALQEALAPRGGNFTPTETAFMAKYNLDPESSCFVFVSKCEAGTKIAPTPEEITTFEGIRNKLPNLAVVELSKTDLKL